MPKCPRLKDEGGLLTYAAGGHEHCLGFLMHFEGKGGFDAEYGEVEVTAEEAKTQNARLSRALLEGLDTCEVGQGAVFYLDNHDPPRVTTWTGEFVAIATRRNGIRYEFTRQDKTFEVRRLSRDGTDVMVTRTA
jgi:hypothetical protein